MDRDEMVNETGDFVQGGVDTTDLAVWAYRAVLDLASFKDFYENMKSDTMTQAAAASTATWPTDLLVPIRLEYNDGSSLYVCQVKDIVYVRENFSPGDTGRPNFVARVGPTAYFDRTADQAYGWTLWYKYRPDDFANGSAVSPYGAEWDEAIVAWMKAMSYARIREWELSDFWKKNYYAYVKGRLGNVERAEGESMNESFAGDIDSDPFSF